MEKLEEIKRFRYSLVLPLVFVLLLWLIKIVDFSERLDLYLFGVFPRNIKGLFGIIFSPLLHSDFNHLISNSIPLLFLGTGIIYFYRDLAYKVIGIIWLVSGICVWIIARDSYHIGASGLIYGIASFLFLSGVIRKDYRLASISLLVVFLYGGLVWGIFPFFPQISWEYHFFGCLSGFFAAVIYRKKGPKPIEWSWEKEEEVNDDDNSEDLTMKLSE
ncbi:MAG: rhomboid family intramembrane serine protease [Bacteroidales bacterium]|nr:rhomboid family intramembrane serine protease [Bacteroidales bacterium]